MPSKEELKLLQALPLDLKVEKTKARIREWVNYYGVDGVYVSFSGGKDSTVLLHLVRQLYPEVEAVFVNTGLEFPEIQKFVKNFDNVTILRPKMRFDEVIKKYGYPVISKDISEVIWYARHGSDYSSRSMKKLNGELMYKGKKSPYNCEKWKPLLDVDFELSHKCCMVMKKNPAHEYAKKTGKNPMTAQMTCESRLREQQWLKNSCNGFSMKRPISNPMSFWTEQDILQYIKQNNLPIASVYGDIVYENGYEMLLLDNGCKLKCSGCQRTGCIFCAFGAHLDKDESRFERLKRTHPKQYEYCMGGGAYDTDGLWKPNENGLGMKHCFDELNKIYGKDFIKY